VISELGRSVSGSVAIVGAADIVSPTGELDHDGRALEMLAVMQALDDAGLRLADVDGVVSAGPMVALQTAEYMGIRPRWSDSTQIGGCSFETHVEHAMLALAAGLADVIVISYASTPRRDAKLGRHAPRGSNAVYGREFLEFEQPYGIRMPVGPYALAASRHMARYGTTSEQLAAIAVSTREWAERNPRARYRTPLTVEDVVTSPFVCSPLHRYDCCLVTDGAAAIVLTRADRAQDLRSKPAYVLGAGTGVSHNGISQMDDVTVTAGVQSAATAFDMAGLSPSDIDVLELYDSFTITVLLALEDIGFCKKGEGGAFVADGRLGPGGSLPANTTGGGLSFTHPGMFGLFLLVEATRQVRGDAGPGQVDGVETAIAHGTGGVLSATSTVILGSSPA
jgi:acetyl-CoA acetyltransferase